MDPNANAVEQMEITLEIQALRDGAGEHGLTDSELVTMAELGERLAELVQALNSWLMRGGALPFAWSHGR